MLKFKDINFGYIDAINFALKKEKEALNNLFFGGTYIKQLNERNKYYLIGEKGTGKTTYAIFMANNEIHENMAEHRTIQQSDYIGFHNLLKSGLLQVSGYAEIWSAILLKYTIDALYKHSGNIDRFFPILSEQHFKAALKYYKDVFLAPENVITSEVVEKIEKSDSGKLTFGNKIIQFAGGGDIKNIHQKTNSGSSVIQSNVNAICNTFKELISKVKLKKNLTIFIDGIDVRPDEMSYTEYIDCIGGLERAAWNLDTEFFGNIKGSRGVIRIVLLLRPDIMASLRIHNLASRIRDNSVYLNWNTTYKDYKKSELFSLCEHILGGQQSESFRLNPGETYWHRYFPWDKDSGRLGKNDDSFVEFLRISYSKPRDIVAYLKELQKACPDDRKSINRHLFFENGFRNAASEYLIETIMDYTNIYLSNDEFKLFRRFFDFLEKKKKFSWEHYKNTYDLFSRNELEKRPDIPDFFTTDIKFLQFLYEANVICYAERDINRELLRWCYRERTISNLSPIIPQKGNYKIHQGLCRALKIS